MLSKDTAPRTSSEQSWIRWFSFSLIILTLIAAAIAFYYTRTSGTQEKELRYVSIQVKPDHRNNQLVTCKLSLLVGPEQEEGIKHRQKSLETLVSVALLKIYQHEKRPDLAAVRQSLLSEINRSLPRKLQIEDVLIQELLAGLG